MGPRRFREASQSASGEPRHGWARFWHGQFEERFSYRLSLFGHWFARESPLMHDDSIAEDLIAQLAYEKWQDRGCPLGEEQQDWYAALYELEAEQALRRGVSRLPRGQR